jgi:hypothetical protein
MVQVDEPEAEALSTCHGVVLCTAYHHVAVTASATGTIHNTLHWHWHCQCRGRTRAGGLQLGGTDTPAGQGHMSAASVRAAWMLHGMGGQGAGDSTLQCQWRFFSFQKMVLTIVFSRMNFGCGT